MLYISIPFFINQWYCFAVIIIFYIFPIAQSSGDYICGSDILTVNNHNIKKKVMKTIRNGEGHKLNCFHTSKVTDMGFLFTDYKNKIFTDFNADISSWDTSSVTSMRVMFDSASSFNGDISSWNTSNVTTMESMFHGASKFGMKLCNWDLRKVEKRFSQFTGSKCTVKSCLECTYAPTSNPSLTSLPTSDSSITPSLRSSSTPSPSYSPINRLSFNQTYRWSTLFPTKTNSSVFIYFGLRLVFGIGSVFGLRLGLLYLQSLCPVVKKNIVRNSNISVINTDAKQIKNSKKKYRKRMYEGE